MHSHDDGSVALAQAFNSSRPAWHHLSYRNAAETLSIRPSSEQLQSATLPVVCYNVTLQSQDPTSLHEQVEPTCCSSRTPRQFALRDTDRVMSVLPGPPRAALFTQATDANPEPRSRSPKRSGSSRGASARGTRCIIVCTRNPSCVLPAASHSLLGLEQSPFKLYWARLPDT